MTYFECGKKEEALKSYLKVLDIEPNHALGYYNLGLVFKDLGKKEEAVKNYLKAIEINPNHPLAHINSGIIFNAFNAFPRL